jgi:hypothetical protein
MPGMASQTRGVAMAERLAIQERLTSPPVNAYKTMTTKSFVVCDNSLSIFLSQHIKTNTMFIIFICIF